MANQGTLSPGHSDRSGGGLLTLSESPHDLPARAVGKTIAIGIAMLGWHEDGTAGGLTAKWRWPIFWRKA